jgi:hypothetical protein
MADEQKADAASPVPVITSDAPAAPTTTGGTHGIEVSNMRVRARSHFHKGPNMSGGLCEPGEEFEVDRMRAAELRANGLVEFADKDDEDAAEKYDPTPPYEAEANGVIMRRRGKVRT